MSVVSRQCPSAVTDLYHYKGSLSMSLIYSLYRLSVYINDSTRLTERHTSQSQQISTFSLAFVQVSKHSCQASAYYRVNTV